MPAVLVAFGVTAAAACSSSTSPTNLTGKYVGTYKMDSVIAAALAQAFPGGKIDSAVGVTGALTLKSDSFYVTLAGSFPQRDSGGFAIDGAGKWTLSGSLFSGTGSGALVGTQLQIQLAGGAALGNLSGWFTKQ